MRQELFGGRVDGDPEDLVDSRGSGAGVTAGEPLAKGVLLSARLAAVLRADVRGGGGGDDVGNAVGSGTPGPVDAGNGGPSPVLAHPVENGGVGRAGGDRHQGPGGDQSSGVLCARLLRQRGVVGVGIGSVAVHRVGEQGGSALLGGPEDDQVGHSLPGSTVALHQRRAAAAHGPVRPLAVSESQSRDALVAARADEYLRRRDISLERDRQKVEMATSQPWWAQYNVPR